MKFNLLPIFVVLVILSCAVKASQKVSQLPLPVFMNDASDAAKAEFSTIISQGDITPAQRRQIINEFIARQQASVQQAYENYNQMLQKHQQLFGISLESELEKARQKYMGHK